VSAVLFEVHPYVEQWDAYLGYAKMLRPDLENIDGFVDNIRYRSLRRPGWILSLSNWRDEKALVRWRTLVRHHDVQVQGRGEVLADYHLRVGQLTGDSHIPSGYQLDEQRLDVTEVGEGTDAEGLTSWTCSMRFQNPGTRSCCSRGSIRWPPSRRRRPESIRGAGPCGSYATTGCSIDARPRSTTLRLGTDPDSRPCCAR
jgi:heme-degrading monooxygenase HmoA